MITLNSVIGILWKQMRLKNNMIKDVYILQSTSGDVIGAFSSLEKIQKVVSKWNKNTSGKVLFTMQSYKLDTINKIALYWHNEDVRKKRRTYVKR